MKVLIACEESQAVCIEFRKLGHEAFSCDILPCSGGHPEWHIQDSIFHILSASNAISWDMMIAFPPCTDLASSGARWFPEKIANGDQGRSIIFFMTMINANIPLIAVENPIGIMSTRYRKPDQIIQPFYFGHPESKSTCLWLKGLPKLSYTNVLSLPESGIWVNQTKSGQNKLTPSPERTKLRSKTYSGIAKAMAEQWGNL